MNTARERLLARLTARFVTSPSKWAGTHCIGLEGVYHEPPYGYPKVYDPRIKKMNGAHRLVWELTYDEIPTVVVHLCPNRWCVNVEHLFAQSAEPVVDDPEGDYMTDEERAAVIVELTHWADAFSHDADSSDDDERCRACNDCAERLRKRIDELKNEDHA